jgi:hypothetical protein
MDSDGGNIVNFSSFRKRARLEKAAGEKTRAEKRREARKQDKAKAAANRIRFGRTGAEKKISKIEAARRERLLDGRRLTRPDEVGEPDDTEPA